MTSVVLEICLLTLCLVVSGATCRRQVADADQREIHGRKCQTSVYRSEVSSLTTMVKGCTLPRTDSRFSYSQGDERMSPGRSRRVSKKASIMGLDNLDFVIRTLNRPRNQMRSSIRQGYYYNAYQGGGRNYVGSTGRRSKERRLVDLFKAGKRSRWRNTGAEKVSVVEE